MMVCCALKHGNFWSLIVCEWQLGKNHYNCTIKVHLYPFHGLYPAKWKFEDENFTDSIIINQQNP